MGLYRDELLGLLNRPGYDALGCLCRQAEAYDVQDGGDKV